MNKYSCYNVEGFIPFITRDNMLKMCVELGERLYTIYSSYVNDNEFKDDRPREQNRYWKTKKTKLNLALRPVFMTVSSLHRQKSSPEEIIEACIYHNQ